MKIGERDRGARAPQLEAPRRARHASIGVCARERGESSAHEQPTGRGHTHGTGTVGADLGADGRRGPKAVPISSCALQNFPILDPSPNYCNSSRNSSVLIDYFALSPQNSFFLFLVMTR